MLDQQNTNNIPGNQHYAYNSKQWNIHQEAIFGDLQGRTATYTRYECKRCITAAVVQDRWPVAESSDLNNGAQRATVAVRRPSPKIMWICSGRYKSS